MIVVLVAVTARLEAQNLNRLTSYNLIPSMDANPLDMKPSHYGDANYFTGYSTSSTWIGYLCKVNSKGNLVWTWKNTNSFSTGNAGLMPRSICLDKKDNITMVGYYNLPSTNDTIKIGKYNLTASPFGLGSFIAKFDSTGKVLNVQSYSGYINFNDVDIDDKGNAYIIGNTQMAFSLGSYSIPKPTSISGGTNSRDFLFSIDSACTVLWAKPLGCLDLGKAVAGNEGALHRISLSKGSNPSIFASGFYLDSFVFGTHKFTSSGQEDAFVVKFDLKGNYLASKSVGSSNMDAFYDVAANSNTLSMTGMYKSATTINGKSFSVSGGFCQTLIVQMDTSLNFLWLDTAGKGCGNYPHLTLDNFYRTCVVTGANGSGNNFLYMYDKSGTRVFSKSYILTGTGLFAGLNPFAITFPEKAPTLMYVIGSYKPSFKSDGKNVSCANTSFRDIALFRYDVPLPCVPQLGNDTGFCGNFSMQLDPKIQNGQYLWSTNDTTNMITVNQGGKYWVRVSKNGCISSDTILLFKDIAKPTFQALSDTITCGTQITKLTVPSNTGHSFKWWNNSTQRTVTAPISGKAWIEYFNYCGSVRDTFLVKHFEIPKPKLGNDTAICSHGAFVLFDGDSTWNSIWSTNDSGARIRITLPGTYWVNAHNACGSGADTIKIDVVYDPLIGLSPDTFTCNLQQITITAKVSNASSVSWNSGQKTSSIQTSSPGTYILKAVNKCMTLFDTIQVVNYPVPVLKLPRDTFVCSNSSIVLHTVSNYARIWSTSDTTINITISQPGLYTAKSTNRCGTSADSVLVSAMSIPKPNLGPDQTVCSNAFPVVLYANTKAGKYTWSNAISDSASAIVRSAGSIWVKATNACGSSSDTVQVRSKNKPMVNLGRDTMLTPPFSLKLDAGNKGNRYQWSTSDTTRSVTVSSPGNYWVKVSNSCGTASDTIHISSSTGIAHANKYSLRIYPNPFSSFIELDFASPGQILDIAVINGLGEELMRIPANNDLKQHIDLSFLDAGIYILCIRNVNGSGDQVLIVKSN